MEGGCMDTQAEERERDEKQEAREGEWEGSRTRRRGICLRSYSQ